MKRERPKFMVQPGPARLWNPDWLAVLDAALDHPARHERIELADAAAILGVTIEDAELLAEAGALGPLDLDGRPCLRAVVDPIDLTGGPVPWWARTRANTQAHERTPSR